MFNQIAEDAVEEETDLSVNPFSTGFETTELSLDNPKKSLRSWFDREGYDLVYDVKEKSAGQFICRIK
jgi:protein phosphatase 1D